MPQPALADTLLDRAESLLADSLRLAADSAARADADTSVISTTRGVGATAREIERAAEEATRGNVGAAWDIATDALGRFLLENLIPAALVAVAFYVAYRVLNGLLRRALARSERIDLGVQQLVLRTLRYGLLAFAAVTVLNQIGVQVAPLIAGLGIAGIAIGFAAQDTVQNLIAGVTILLDRPFRVGDNIELMDTFGTVEEITLRTTRVRTLDNQMAILPNAKVIAEKILNHSMHRGLRIVVPFGIAYKESPAEARQAVLAAVSGDARLHPDFEPSVVVTALGESSVDMELRVHLKDAAMEVPVRLELQERVFETLREAGIEIPFPHLQLFVDEAKAFEGAPFLRGGADGPAAEA